MKRLLGKKPNPPQQSAPPPTVQKPPQPPPLFARFASSNSSSSSHSPPVISGPVPLAPRDSIHRQSGHHDGSPPKPTNPRVVAPTVQRNRTYEKQLPANGGRDDKPLPDPEQTITRRGNPHGFHREPAQSFEPRTSPTDSYDLPSKPQRSIPEFEKRGYFPVDMESSSVSLDAPPTPTKSKDTTRKPTRVPISGSPERKSTKPAPTPDPLSSGLLALQNQPDRSQPRRKYSPLEAFGLTSSENSPAPSTTTSSVNLPSQNPVSAPSKVPILPNYCIRLTITSPHPEL